MHEPWTIIRRFDQFCFRSHNSSLKGAIKVKFASKYSSLGCKVCVVGVVLGIRSHCHKIWILFLA